MNQFNDLKIELAKPGIIREIDKFGRMKAIPVEYRKALGIDFPGAKVRIILLKNGLMIVPHEEE